jgi:hypothetical protein
LAPLTIVEQVDVLGDLAPCLQLVAYYSAVALGREQCLLFSLLLTKVLLQSDLRRRQQYAIRPVTELKQTLAPASCTATTGQLC